MKFSKNFLKEAFTEELQKSLLVYGVTEKKWLGSKTIGEVVEMAISGGVTFIQLREKNLVGKELMNMAVEVKLVCQNNNIPFVINDDVDLAVEIEADGVHIGQTDMESSNARTLIGENMILGVSVQTVEQAILAERKGADYLGVGAVFPTYSKEDVSYVDYVTLKAICNAVKIPVVAIGGINRENIYKLKGSGICGVAVISEIFGSEDIKKAARTLSEAAKKHLL